jgi:hypothetical protein
MTRDWVFTLTTPGLWYNLWTLIQADASFTDPTFSNSPYVPSSVSELKFQNQTAGSVVYRSDNKLEAGFQLTSYSWDVDRSGGHNCIDLKNTNFSTNLAGSKLYVKITSN